MVESGIWNPNVEPLKEIHATLKIPIQVTRIHDNYVPLDTEDKHGKFIGRIFLHGWNEIK